MKTIQLHQLFLGRAQGVGHLMRDRVWRMTAFASNEALRVEVIPGEFPTIRYRRASDGDALVEIGAVTPGPLTAVHWGEEQQLSSQEIGSTEETIDNRRNSSPIAVKFSDAFSETRSRTQSDKTSVSLSVTVKANESIAGVASFDESITAAANREASESEGSSSTRSVTGEESTTVEAGKRVRITETRTRSDVMVPVTAQGNFTHTLGIGKHSGGDWRGRDGQGHGYWNSFDDFIACVQGSAPDNLSFATNLREHPPYHADLYAIRGLTAQVSYDVEWRGRIIRSYTVMEF